jgi:TPR repeat protein/membrane protease YdiL (CAAX protease family)
MTRTRSGGAIAGAVLSAALLAAASVGAARARADSVELPPSPDQPGSHERFLKQVTSARAATYREVLAEYNATLAANPDDVTVALERCQFILSAGAPDQDTETEEDSDNPAARDCRASLLQRFPNAPAVVQFHIDQLWGDAAIDFGQAKLDARTVEWSTEQLARFLKSLAFAYFARDKLPQALQLAQLTRANDPSVDVSLIIATDHQRADRKREAIAEIARAGLGDKLRGHQKLMLLLKCHGFNEALQLVEAMKQAGLPVGALQEAQALEGAGRTEAARAKYGELAAQVWNKPRGLERLFYIDLRKGDRKRAGASYAALRNEGWNADPLLRHRLALARACPWAPWQLRDALGLMALCGLGLLLALLPLGVIVPIHYLSLLRGPRPKSGVPGSARWSLPQLWALCTCLLWIQSCILYVFSYDELIELLSNNARPEPQTKAELARDALYVLLASGAGVFVWLRRGDYAGLIRCSWSVRRIARNVVGSLMLVLLVQGVSTIAARVLGLSSPAASPSIITARELLGSILTRYGPWLLFPLVVLWVPVYEEIAFRSVLLGSASRHLPFMLANVLQAGLFMVLHDEPSRYPALFAIGFSAGLLTRRSGGLAPAISLHAAVNFIAACGIGLQASPAAADAANTHDARVGLKSRNSLDRECEHKRLGACHELAERYEVGFGVPADQPRAVRFYRQACDAGLAPSCNRLGSHHEEGVGVRHDLQIAAKLYERACTLGSQFGCYNLGNLRERGGGVALDLVQAARLFKQACDGGVSAACCNLGWLRYEGKGGAFDYAQAARLFRRSCEAQEASGCNGLGVSHEEGRGSAQDFVKAAELYARACNATSIAGCANLARLYASGQGVIQDLARARELNHRACEAGIQSACAALP